MVYLSILEVFQTHTLLLLVVTLNSRCSCGLHGVVFMDCFAVNGAAAVAFRTNLILAIINTFTTTRRHDVTFDNILKIFVVCLSDNR